MFGMTETFTSRQYNQDASAVKRAAKDGPVIITERGKPALVLMSYAAYERLKGRPRRKVPLVDFLQGLALEGLDLTREPDPGRDGPL
jgi:prevent-host-death family protein